MDKPDDANDNIFAAGNSGPESNPVNGDAITTANSAGIEGRIDPALARAAQSGGAPGDGGHVASGDAPGDAPGAGEPVKRGPGRPKGPAKTSGEKGEARSIRASFIEKTLYSIHLGLASVASAPEFKLDKDDAKELADAVAGVLAYYKVKMTAKQEAFAILMEAAAKVYPAMVMTYAMRLSLEAKNKAHRRPQPPQQSHTAPVAVPVPATMMPPGFDPSKITIPGD